MKYFGLAHCRSAAEKDPGLLIQLRHGSTAPLISILVVIGISLGAMMSLTSCAGNPVGTTKQPTTSTDRSPLHETRQGGTLVVGMGTSSLATLDPAAYSDRSTETVLRNIFDGLVTRTKEGEIVPELAQSYRWLDDTTIEFTLKPDVVFHNGEALTAEDVVFTFERILHEEVGAPRRGFVQEVAEVERVDTHTVRFHLKSPWPVFLQMLVHNQIVPGDLVSWSAGDLFACRPAGSGPFKYVRGELDREIVLERFADYYGGAEALPPVSPPYLQQVVFRMMPDEEQRVAALLAGDVHIIQGVSGSAVEKLANNPDVLVKTTLGTRPKLLDLNVSQPPFDDARVRRALNYAIDANELLAGVANGFGVILPGPLSPANVYADPNLSPYGHDPEKALELLAEAGLSPEDVIFDIDAYGPYVPIARAVALQLQDFGMKVYVRTCDYQELRPLLLDCERQAFLRDWGTSAFDPVGYVEAKWHTREPGTPNGRGNYSCYSNADVDRLIETGASEPDPDIRQVLYAEMQSLIRDDAPAVFLYVPQEIEAASAKVRNWEPSPDGRINLHDVWLEE